MSRLIDADAFIEEARNRIDMQDLYLPVHIKEMVLDEMPTVEAIPIEFVEKEAERMRASENPAMRMNSVILSALIRDWREK